MTTFLALNQAADFATMPLVLVDSDGLLVDGETVRYRVLSDDLTVQHFPVAGYEAVTTGSGHDGTRRYHPYDSGGGTGFTPSTSPAVPLVAGTRYMLEWQHRLEAADPFTTIRQKFHVEANGQLAPHAMYLSIQDVRDEGIAVGTLSNARAYDLILQVHQLIEKLTRQPFRPVYLTMDFDGNGADLAQFPVPIIGVESIRLNRSSQDEATANFKVYNGRQAPNDDRRNPKIAMIGQMDSTNFYVRAGMLEEGRLRFLPGRKNQRIVGAFGYLEQDGTAPKAIGNAALRMVAFNAAQLGTTGAPSLIAGPIQSETTDRHSVSYQASAKSFVLEDGLYVDPVVQSILRRYRSAVDIDSPAEWI